MKLKNAHGDILFYLFILVLPFAYWIEKSNPFIWYLLVVVIFYGIAIKMFIRAGMYRKQVILLVSISASIIVVYFIKFILVDYPNNFYYTRFFLTPFLFIAIFGLYGRLSNVTIYNLVKYFLIINSSILILEALLVNFNLVGIDISPAYHTTPNYQPAEGQYARPFGLTGNPSVNGMISLYLFVLYQYFVRVKGNKPRLWVSILSLIGIAASGSGQAYIVSFLAGLIYILWNRRLSSYIIGLVVLGLFLGIVVSGAVPKISLDYLTLIYNLIIEQFMPFMYSNLDFNTFLFGNPSPDWPIDLFPLFVIGNYGILYFFIYWIVVFSGFLAFRNKFMTLAAIVIFLGTLHYPTGFYFSVQVVTALVVILGISQKFQTVSYFKRIRSKITQNAKTSE